MKSIKSKKASLAAGEDQFAWLKMSEPVIPPFGVFMFAVILTGILMLFASCNKEESTLNPKQNTGNSNIGLPTTGITSALPSSVLEQVNLVSNTGGFGALRLNANLLNPWGVAYSPEGELWVVANHKGMAIRFNREFEDMMAPVNIPLHGVAFGSSPDGIVYNPTADFKMPAPTPETAKFIFSTEDGIIAAWSSGSSAITVADRSATGAVYKGLAMANNGGENLLYATNFNAGTVDVFDATFKYLPGMKFIDPSMPAGFAPFNIKSIDGNLYVTYAKQDAAKHDDQAGAGNGYIDIFATNGTFIRRFASQGTLNSPWGLAMDESSNGGTALLLVGNFGDGRINIFDARGDFKSQMQSNGKPIAIEGLWAISFPETTEWGSTKAVKPLYFTAGPQMENNGLFGYITAEGAAPKIPSASPQTLSATGEINSVASSRIR